MKKCLSLLLLCAILTAFASCADGSSDKVELVLNSMEYSIYTNVFSGSGANSYINKSYEAEGVFTVLHDSYNERDRYYVWGYADNTLCCDWQWEFVPQSTDNLPPIGSLVKVKGIFSKSNHALDGYWLENASVKTLSSYKKAIDGYDMTTMSPTLARVQLINMLSHADEYNGKAVKLYGRVASGQQMQHPYYNGAWTIPIEYEEPLPAIGTYVTVTGIFSGTSAADGKIIASALIAD